MFAPQAIGYVRSPYKETKQVPKGLGAQHEAEGILEILPQFEAGLTDIEGFSTFSQYGFSIASTDSN